ncbi:DUF317 domain-containing protein [Streptomyces microflavus]|uniref:DUF317 domain-containing protein n=1 Tax=Streptomyces microflavus TaxID=1919 RepID=UPI0036882002
MSPTVHGRPAARILRSNPAPSRCLLVSAIAVPPLSPAARHRNPCRTTAVTCPFPGLPSPADDPEFAHGRRHSRGNDYALRHDACQRTDVGKTAGQRRDPSNREHLCHRPSGRCPSHGGRSPLALRRPQCGLDLPDALGWAIVDTPEANVHATSLDGGVYVGWLPEDPSAWQRNIVWHVRVQPADGDAWVQEFGLHTPSDAVAGFLAALVTNSSR